MDATLPSFRPPAQAPTPAGARTVPRARLLRRLGGASSAAVVLLRAPAGYGKTTLLAQWAAADARPCAWVSAPDDPLALVAALARALDAVEPLAPATLAALTDAEALDRRLLDALDATLAVARRPLLLVLDDAHLARGAAAARVLALLAARAGRGIQIALGARAAPALPLARLRAENGVLELRARDLALDAHESALLLARACPALSTAEAVVLAARAEGWAAALALAARAFADPDRPREVVSFSGADRLLAAYVREQLLAELDPAVRELLLRSAPLGMLSGALCDALLARTGSGLVLRDLADGNLPLEPLDRAERRFRLHPLLAEALLAELRRGDGAWEPEAHRRASAWHARRHELAAAVDHAVAGGDAARVGALLWDALPAHALGAAPERLDGWLRALGATPVATTPALSIAAALRAFARAQAGEAGRLAAVAADALERSRAAATAPAALAPAQARSRAGGAASAALAPAQARAGVALVRAALAREGVAGMRADADAARAALADQPGWRALVSLLCGTAALLAGDAEAAQARLEEGSAHAGGVPLVEALCLAQLALPALDGEQPEQAGGLARRALLRTERARLARQPLCALAHAVAAFADAQSGALEAARARLARSRQVLPAAAELPPWYEAELRFARARTLLRLSDAAGARAELARMSRAARRLPDAPLLHRWIEDAWARADAFAASAVQGPARLTLAELRVLRLLPSHFSLREIAARLHVSANTVKTQAHAVYRKLDVSSRSEAVARAREIGLVDGAYR